MMKNVPQVTCQEIADFLLSLPDDTPVTNISGDNSREVGCIMTQFARSKGWKFEHSYSVFGKWEDKDGNVVAVISDFISHVTVLDALFQSNEYSSKFVYGTAGHLKARLRPHFKN
jgi:hypothetical protein